MIPEEKIRAFVEDHYYCDDLYDSGERVIWEPFENYSRDWIEDQIETDIEALVNFLKHNLGE
jgi:hypothetical protein